MRLGPSRSVRVEAEAEIEVACSLIHVDHPQDNRCEPAAACYSESLPTKSLAISICANDSDARREWGSPLPWKGRGRSLSQAAVHRARRSRHPILRRLRRSPNRRARPSTASPALRRFGVPPATPVPDRGRLLRARPSVPLQRARHQSDRHVEARGGVDRELACRCSRITCD